MSKGTRHPQSWLAVKLRLAELDCAAGLETAWWADMTPVQQAICRLAGAIDFHERVMGPERARLVHAEPVGDIVISAIWPTSGN